MELHIKIDDDLVREYVSRNSSPIFTIYWEHDGSFYPCEDWIDFGAVITGWWLKNMIDILNGSDTGTLMFMDGPYEFDISVLGNRESVRLTGRTVNTIWVVPIKPLCKQVISSSDLILREFMRLGVTTREDKGLEMGIRVLRSLLKKM